MNDVKKNGKRCAIAGRTFIGGRAALTFDTAADERLVQNIHGVTCNGDVLHGSVVCALSGMAREVHRQSRLLVPLALALYGMLAAITLRCQSPRPAHAMVVMVLGIAPPTLPARRGTCPTRRPGAGRVEGDT